MLPKHLMRGTVEAQDGEADDKHGFVKGLESVPIESVPITVYEA